MREDGVELLELDHPDVFRSRNECWSNAAHHVINSLVREVRQNMADITTLESAVENIVAVDAAAATEIASLANEIQSLEAGQPITQAQIDSLTSKLTDAATSLSNAASTAEPAPATPADPAPAQSTEAPASTDAPAQEVPAAS